MFLQTDDHAVHSARWARLHAYRTGQHLRHLVDFELWGAYTAVWVAWERFKNQFADDPIVLAYLTDACDRGNANLYERQAPHIK